VQRVCGGLPRPGETSQLEAGHADGARNRGLRLTYQLSVQPPTVRFTVCEGLPQVDAEALDGLTLTLMDGNRPLTRSTLGFKAFSIPS